MKRLAILIFLVVTTLMQAQSGTRPVVLSWTASTASTVTGYSIFSCTVATGGTSCTPSVTATPLTTVTGVTYTATEPAGSAYGFSVVAVSPACTPTTPLTSPCGNSVPVTLTYVPVPFQPAGETNVVVVVP